MTGCSEKSVENIGEIEDVIKYLPDFPFEWEYDGFGNYYHSMKIEKIIVLQDSLNYKISGEVVSEKNATNFEDYIFGIRYIVNKYGLRQEKNEKKMMDSKFDSLYLLKFPIIKGNSWREVVVDKDGNVSNIEATITNIDRVDGLKKISITYDEKNSKYFEKREILENYGIVSFFKELEYDGSIYNYSYQMINQTDLVTKKNNALEIEIFLNRYNFLWQDFFNDGDTRIFDVIDEDSMLRNVLEEHSKTNININISFKKLVINEMIETEGGTIVNVTETYNKILNNEMKKEVNIIEYEIVLKDGKYFVKNYIIKKKVNP